MKVLLITDDPAAETNLREKLEEIAGGDELTVKVVAPLRPESTLDLLTGDVDDAKAGAEERATSAAAESAGADAVRSTEAKVGDADQLLAIDDALAEFDADRIVLVDPDDEDLAEAVRERYGLPVSVISAS